MSEGPGTAPQQPAPAGASGGRPPRYPRTTNGLIGSLIVTLLAIGGFVAFRALNRDDLEVRPTAVDYLASVNYAREQGLDVVYPPELPQGWMANSVDVVPGDRPAWGIGILTDDEKFVGLRQEDRSLDELLHTYVDENPAEGDPIRVTGSVARTWQSFSAAGGDHAFAAEVGGDTVLVYGSASAGDLRSLLGDLTVAPAR